MTHLLLKGEQSDRLNFNSVSEENKSDWLRFMADPRAHMHWFEPNESPEVKVEKWYAKQDRRYRNNLGGMNALTERSTGEFVGHAGLLVQTVDGVEELEIGYSLMPDAWGKGYATEAAMFLRDYGFKNTSRDSLISIIAITNEPSKRVALRNGMHVSSETMYNDNAVEIYRITREAWETLP